MICPVEKMAGLSDPTDSTIPIQDFGRFFPMFTKLHGTKPPLAGNSKEKLSKGESSLEVWRLNDLPHWSCKPAMRSSDLDE